MMEQSLHNGTAASVSGRRAVMRRLLLGLALLIHSSLAYGEIKPGDYLMLFARIVDCGPLHHLVDFAEVLENGEATFSNDLVIAATSMAPETIADTIADAVAAETGQRPESFVVQVLPGYDKRGIVVALRRLVRPIECPRSEPRDNRDGPKQWEGYNRRVAGVNANGAIRRELSPGG